MREYLQDHYAHYLDHTKHYLLEIGVDTGHASEILNRSMLRVLDKLSDFPNAYLKKTIINETNRFLTEKYVYLDLDEDNEIFIPAWDMDRYCCTLCGHELTEENTHVITWHWVNPKGIVRYKSTTYHTPCNTPCPLGFVKAGYHTRLIPYRYAPLNNPWEGIDAALDVRSLLNKLSDRDRLCVEAHYSKDEINSVAAQLGIQPKSVQKISERAINKLKKIIIKVS